MNNIHLEPLGNGVKIYVSESYHFSTDTILLADFSKPKAYKKCADLGTGCGTIPLLWLKGDKSLKIDAVELQQNACKLAEKSVELNGFADNMKIINLLSYRDASPLEKGELERLIYFIIIL